MRDRRARPRSACKAAAAGESPALDAEMRSAFCEIVASPRQPPPLCGQLARQRRLGGRIPATAAARCARAKFTLLVTHGQAVPLPGRAPARARLPGGGWGQIWAATAAPTRSCNLKSTSRPRPAWARLHARCAAGTANPALSGRVTSGASPRGTGPPPLRRPASPSPSQAPVRGPAAQCEPGRRAKHAGGLCGRWTTAVLRRSRT